MLVLLDDCGNYVAARNATLWERLVAHLRASSLDRALAAGASPDSDPALALRAQTLVRPSMRRALAQTMQRLLLEAMRPPSRAAPYAWIGLGSVKDVADALQMLIERVSAPAPVSARGVAQVHILLTDGCGPLYHGGNVDELRAEVLRAAEALRATSSW